MLVSVVDHGSLRRAAAELGLTPSAVSQQIRRLEQEVGVTLFRRSTRRLTLTEAGEAYYQGCAAMVAAARAAHEQLADQQDTAVGELRVSAPAGFAALHLVHALAPFLARHPKLALRLIVTDEPVDVIRERIDLAITISRPLPSSSLVRKHLAHARRSGRPRLPVPADVPSHLRGAHRSGRTASPAQPEAAGHEQQPVLDPAAHPSRTGPLLPRRARGRGRARVRRARARAARLVGPDPERGRPDARAYAAAREDPDGGGGAARVSG